MFNNVNNKKLILLFVVLLVIVGAVFLVDSKKGERTFRSEIFDLDTTMVTSIEVNPKGDDKPNVALVKENNRWSVQSEGKSYAADPNIAKNLLAELQRMKPERIAATNKANWGKFEVTDSAATIVTVKAGKKNNLDIYLGKFSYIQPKNQMPQQYGGMPQGTMLTYVRRGDEEEVYSVQGFLTMTFNREVNDFRNKTVIKSNRFDWTRLSFTYPDSSFSLYKENEKWMIDGLIADSTSVVEYLKNIASLNSSAFVDDIQPTNSVYSLKIEGVNFAAPIAVDAFPADSAHQYLITSSQNKGVYFSGKEADLTNKIFVGKTALMAAKEE